jgi:hypothetical protein
MFIRKGLLMLLTSALTTLGAMAGSSEAEAVPLWGRWGHAFTARRPAVPETELTLQLTSPSGRQQTVSGYWDGGETWGARFMPDEEGEWRYRTRSEPAVTGLDGETGTFRCRRVDSSSRFLQHGAVRVSANRRFLEHVDKTPFFWLGDTVWNGPLLAGREDWDTFLRDRVAKRFTAIQFVMAAPWRTAPTNAEGQVAFTGREQIEINPQFFQRMDERMEAINAHGLLAVPVLLWAIRGDENPGWSLPEDQAIRLASYMVARYGAHHVVWILPGDGTYTGEVAERWKRIGRAVFGGKEHAPVTLHPGGMQWPYEAFKDEAWLDLLGYQSGHGDDDRTLQWIHSGPPSEEWKKPPARPFINLEPPYEDHISYQSKQRHTAYNIRRATYWSLLNAPPAGLTYGGHGIWSWQTKAGVPLAHDSTGMAKPWHEAMALPGSSDMKHMAALFTSLPWWQLRPADDLLTAQPGGDDPARHVSAARTESGDVVLLYLPVGGDVELISGAIHSSLRAEWFDPRTGQRKPAERTGAGKFSAPDKQDWVLLLRKA